MPKKLLNDLCVRVWVGVWVGGWLRSRARVSVCVHVWVGRWVWVYAYICVYMQDISFASLKWVGLF